MSKTTVRSREVAQSPTSSLSSVMIAKRSLSLSRTYVVIAIILSIIGIVVSNVGHVLLGLNLSQIPQTQA
jgi:hypothetical protein